MTPRPAKHVIRWWLRLTRFAGITLPPFGIFIRAESLNNPRLIRHEQAHWAQYERMGLVRFYVLYVFYFFRYGYYNHPMEIEARSAE
jgi:hypothetical protein